MIEVLRRFYQPGAAGLLAFFGLSALAFVLMDWPKAAVWPLSGALMVAWHLYRSERRWRDIRAQ